MEPTDKKELRLHMEATRAGIAPDERNSANARICAGAIRLLAALEWRSQSSACGPLLFTYAPFRTEVDVTPVWQWCAEAGIGLAAPKIIKAGGSRMQLHLINGPDDLEPGAWGIPEPKAACLMLPEAEYRRIRAVLVPGLAFDPQMGRLGYGGGFYDRFFARLRELGMADPYRLGVAYDSQIVEEVPTEPHDVRMDAIVSDKRTFV